MFKDLFGGDTSSGLVQAAFRDFSNMLEQSGKMLDLSLAALFQGRTPERDLDEMDDVIDEGERMIRRTVLEHLSIDPGRDLTASLVLVSMVQDAERIGDFARGLAELPELTSGPLQGPIADRLYARAGRIRSMIDDCERAFRESEEEAAREVLRQHVEHRRKLHELVVEIAASDMSADQAVVHAVAARILRRISAHLSNIASSVVQPFDRVRHGDEEA